MGKYRHLNNRIYYQVDQWWVINHIPIVGMVAFPEERNTDLEVTHTASVGAANFCVQKLQQSGVPAKVVNVFWL